MFDARRALDINPNLFWITGNLADALLLKDQTDEAIAIFKNIANQPGPNGYKNMCEAILDDMRVFRDAELVSQENIARVENEVGCKPEL